MKNFLSKNKTALIVAILLAISLGATAAFLFSEPKTEVHHETRVADVTSPDEEGEDVSYMQVSIPGYSEEDYKKYSEEEVSYLAQYDKDEPEENDKNTNSNSNNEEKKKTTVVVPAYTEKKNENQSGQNGNSGNATSPSIVNHYYTDTNGNRAYVPDKNGNTVYVIEYSKGQTLSQEQVQSLISSYLASNEVISGEAANGVMNSSGNSSNIDLTNGSGNNNSSQSSGNSSNIDISEDSNSTAPATSVYSSDSSPIARILQSSKVVASQDEQAKSSITENAPTDSIALSISGSVGKGNDGRVIVGSVGTSPYNITSLEWRIRTIAGEANLTDSENDFTKNIHLDDRSAAEVYVIASYKDGTVRQSKTITIKHKNYRAN